jgi:aryl-alcohol dehydrogenase-like predicted oxidoreductase
VTFGEQCDEEQSFKVMDAALEQGVNFFDVAEMYPVSPPVMPLPLQQVNITN